MNFPDATRQHRVELLTAIVLSLVLIGCHAVVLLSAGPLWRDEISSLTLATKPTWSEAWAALVFDPFPAFFFILLRTWHGLFGGADFTLRILGFCIGLGSIGALWISARLTRRRVPLLALAIFGLSPTLIIWGDSLRPYGVGVFWIVIAFGCFWRVLVNPRVPEIVLATFVATMSVQSILTNAVLILACGLAAALVAIRRRKWRTAAIVMGIGAIAGASLIPYFGVLERTRDWAEIRKASLPLSAYFEVLFEALAAGGVIMAWSWTLFAITAVTITCWLQWHSSSAQKTLSDQDSSLYALLAGALGLMSTMFFFRFLSWPTNVWYYLPMMALLAVAIDLAIASRWNTFPVSVARSGAAILVAIVCCTVVFERLQMRMSNLDIVAQVIATRAAQNDLVVIYPFVDGITFQRYYHGTVEWTTVPQMQDLSLHRWDELMERARQPETISPVLRKIDQTLRSGHRVWVVSTFPLGARPGHPPIVVPLSDSNPRRIGYFLSGWSALLAADLRDHACRLETLDLSIDQPISKYEHSRVAIFSGWKETVQVSD